MLKYRRITPEDDEAIAKIIRASLESFHLDIPGTAYFDPELAHLSTFYNSKPESRCYFIALNDKDEVAGGIGVAEFANIPDCAELQKLYLDDTVKGHGYSKKMVALAEDWARKAGYKKLYLETHSNLSVAMKLYEKLGFEELPKPDFVFHSTMDHFFIKNL